MPSDRCEILIQRCVDNECTPQERQELIQLLDDQKEGWKALACTYMEEQLFQTACQTKLLPPEPVVSRPVPAVPRRDHWFHQRSVSMLLSACVVCLLSVIGWGEFRQRQTSVQTKASPEALTSNTSQRNPVASMAVSSQPKTAWLEAEGMAPQELPVYSDLSEFIPSLEAFRQQSRQSAQRFGLSGSGSRLRYIKLEVDGEYLLFPVEETAIERRMQ